MFGSQPNLKPHCNPPKVSRAKKQQQNKTKTKATDCLEFFKLMNLKTESYQNSSILITFDM